MIQNVRHLEWDSDFFGFNVARIESLDIDDRGLASVLRELKSRNYRMVYWSIPSEQQETAGMARAFGGFLADEKVTFVKELAGRDLVLPRSSYVTVPYPDSEPNAALINLALQSGEYSRFRLDPLFPDELFEKLYTCWITRSVRKEIAWMVLVVKDTTDILGLITLGTKDSRGDIGLVAVSEHARGKGIGRLLVADADSCFAEQGFTVSQVVTQRVNTGACKLYESCGYHIEKIENIFHFWL
jgi:dTDP-4-amino-4,6-dideoxy-D-galactose acyltransferase